MLSGCQRKAIIASVILSAPLATYVGWQTGTRIDLRGSRPSVIEPNPIDAQIDRAWQMKAAHAIVNLPLAGPARASALAEACRLTARVQAPDLRAGVIDEFVAANCGTVVTPGIP